MKTDKKTRGTIWTMDDEDNENQSTSTNNDDDNDNRKYYFNVTRSNQQTLNKQADKQKGR